MNKAFLNFFILLSVVFFANAAEQQPLENTQLPQTLSFTSALYDASPLTCEEDFYKPFSDHLILASKASIVDDKTVGTYSYVMFFKKDNDLKQRSFPVSKPFTQGKFDKETLPEDIYNTYLRLLLEHAADGETEVCNIFATMLNDDQSKRRSHAQGWYHAEQRMLIDMRYSFTKSILLLLKEEVPDEILGIGVLLHSTQDVCQTCGPTIENVLNILKENFLADAAKAKRAYEEGLKKIKSQQPKHMNYVELFNHCIFKNISVFSLVSSSRTYGTAYKKRPSCEKENENDYFAMYIADANVKKGGFNISNLNGKSLYFWVPSLKDIDCQKTEQGLAVNVKTTDVLQNFYQMMPILLDQDRCKPLTELTLPQNVEFSTKSNDFSIINPRDIGKFKQLRVLNCAQTNARSAYLCEMFQSLSHLVVLNLNGAIQHYSEDGGVKNTKSKDLTKLFQTIGSLPSLENLAMDDNAINIDEFRLWIEDDEKMLLQIKKLSLKKNNIFSMSEDCVHKVCQALDVFMNARPGLSIDLSSNGDKPAALNLHERVICLEVENDKKEEAVAAAGSRAPNQVKSSLDQLTDADWKKIEDGEKKKAEGVIPSGTLKQVRSGNYGKGTLSYKKVEEAARAYGLIA